MKKNLLAIVLGLVISLIILEVGLRILNPFQFRVKGNKIVLRANQTYHIKNTKLSNIDNEIVHSKNNIGFRGEDLPTNIEDRVSIITVGGSTTECLYITDGKTWPDVLKRLLEKDIGDVWLNNAGLDGHSTFGHILLLEDHISKIKPGYALFLVGANDVGREDLRSFDKDMLLQREIHGPRDIFLLLANNSETVNAVLSLYRVIKAKNKQLGHDPINLLEEEQLDLDEDQWASQLAKHEQSLEAYRRRLEKMIQICIYYNIKPVFMSQPALYGGAIDDVTSVDLARIKFTKELNSGLKWEILKRYNDVTKDVAKTHGLLFIDIAKEMPKSSRYYYDFQHYNNLGCQKVAEIIYKYLKPYLKKDLNR